MSKSTVASAGPAASDRGAFEPEQLEPEQLELHRRELTGYCYRMLGSFAEAEDAVQETMIRAWKARDGFEGRSSVRTWLHRVATNVCIDMLRGSKRRALPMGLVPSTTTAQVTDMGPQLGESTWVLPAPDARVLSDHADPAQLIAQRDTVRLAFLAALQHLPPRQRAVLLLREVLDWSAAEVAQLLGGSVASVNSALQRARATLAAREPEASRSAADDGSHGELLAEYMDAFERYDVQRLTALLHEDAVQAMPPYPLWLRGAAEIGRWMLGPGAECRGSRMLPAGAANAAAAFGQYRADGRGGHQPFALHVVRAEGDRIAEIHSYLMPELLFPLFGLPAVP
ncbi:sigma-70 family RNA polymerase sigma factor [Actinocrinis puniceicyclus]|uniref:Sigma-70 family RNA polymerase sigma factor n=1 Tax=Actinocrinis puniceicyclus TaxID=977794 RepID=A0A8J7WNL7_9ACTN|nr:sigma-70 family RNA polymerase sigma factor [Actinocrinis puniceicyclus]MBS2963432.1 sigma-70 family RNA polymerase sigma factor [Actinocrinis puniceicyclus]